MRCSTPVRRHTVPHRVPCPLPPQVDVVVPRRIAVIGDSAWVASVAACTTDSPAQWEVLTSNPHTPSLNPEVVAQAAHYDLTVMVYSQPWSPVRVLPWMDFPRPLALTRITGTSVRCGPVLHPGRVGCLHCYALRDQQAPALDAPPASAGRAGIGPLVRGLWDTWLRTASSTETQPCNPVATPGVSVEMCLRRATMARRRWAPHPACRCPTVRA